jgi:hypothetical protein
LGGGEERGVIEFKKKIQDERQHKVKGCNDNAHTVCIKDKITVGFIRETEREKSLRECRVKKYHRMAGEEKIFFSCREYGV